MNKSDIVKAIHDSKYLPEKEKVTLFNAVTLALKDIMSDISQDPVLSIQLIPADCIEANDYNPNKVASPEMDLLEDSIRADGVTMPVVVVCDKKREKCVTVDGFHRQVVIGQRLARKYIPCSIIDTDISNRMASTIRHNRARGKHQVDMMADIVKALMSNGWEDTRIAKHLGMTGEELLRLKQTVGIAEMLAGSEYSKSWGPIDEPDISE